MEREWDQWTADNRDLETMRRIAQEVMAIDDDDRLYAYAEEQHLTINEVVYYLNAYEAGGDEGLQAIRNPDIIPPDTARKAIETIGTALDECFEGRLPYRLTDEGTAVGLYEIQQRGNGDRFLFPICQFRWTLATGHWHLYWMRKFDAWWPYSLPDQGRKHTLEGRVQQVFEDEYGCFWG